MTKEEQIQAIEKELGFTREDADQCSCYANPNGPCANCWSLGWRMGGIESDEPELADCGCGARGEVNYDDGTERRYYCYGSLPMCSP
jgi:hypothetical protein